MRESPCPHQEVEALAVAGAGAGRARIHSHVESVAHLPCNATGKLLKTELMRHCERNTTRKG